jgi:hypothetical protein
VEKKIEPKDGYQFNTDRPNVQLETTDDITGANEATAVYRKHGGKRPRTWTTSKPHVVDKNHCTLTLRPHTKKEDDDDKSVWDIFYEIRAIILGWLIRTYSGTGVLTVTLSKSGNAEHGATAKTNLSTVSDFVSVG